MKVCFKRSRWWDVTIFMSRKVSNAIYPFGIFLASDYKKHGWESALTGIAYQHETIHIMQQKKWFKKLWWFGLLMWFFCYVCVFPIFFNPFRWRWECESYMASPQSHMTPGMIERRLAGWNYGWLIPRWHRWMKT